MSKESVFFIYLIERYAEYKKSSASEVLAQWDKLKITDMIYNLYEMYHCEALENAFEDIDEIVKSKVDN
ncbi:MAG: DUF3791 domain-containing protein [Treponema sp.]|nr:DUF3791 domain-containing protein [Treponema sp.]